MAIVTDMPYLPDHTDPTRTNFSSLITMDQLLEIGQERSHPKPRFERINLWLHGVDFHGLLDLLIMLRLCIHFISFCTVCHSLWLEVFKSYWVRFLMALILWRSGLVYFLSPAMQVPSMMHFFSLGMHSVKVVSRRPRLAGQHEHVSQVLVFVLGIQTRIHYSAVRNIL